MIEDTRRVNDLESGVLEISMTNIQSFGGERVRLNFNICLADCIDKA